MNTHLSLSSCEPHSSASFFKSNDEVFILRHLSFLGVFRVEP